MLSEELKKIIKEIPDFPKPGISFKDITPILQHPELFDRIVEDACLRFKNVNFDAVVGIESRGFLFGPMMAKKLNVPFIPIRKKGKLPRKTFSSSYSLEYGEATIELHSEDIKSDSNILIHDDLLATGGTAKAAAELVKKCGAHVSGFSFLIELDFLQARSELQAISAVSSIVHY